jgi:hypothetical protein
MPDHLKDGLVAHFSLLAESHKRQQILLMKQQDEIKALTEEVNELKIQTKQLSLLPHDAQIVPVDFIVENPRTYGLFNSWSSMSFYTHYQGYKLRLSFFRLNTVKFIIRCYLVQGEFDDLLKWPLKAVMKFKLLHQQEQDDDYESSIQLNYNERLKGGADDAPRGNLKIRRSVVHRYIHNSYLHIKVVGVHF